MRNVSLNFGAIKDTVYRVSVKEIINESKDSKKENSLKKFIKKIKEEPLLKIQYMIFENLTKGHFENERLAERYINQNMSTLKKVSFQNILEVNKKTRSLILDEKYVQGDSKFENLYESIHNLIESETTIGYKDVNKSHESYESVLSHLQREISDSLREKEEKKDMPKLFSWKYINEHAVSNFNKRYSHLNEEDKNLFKILVSSDDVKFNYAKDLKENTLHNIESLLEDETHPESLLEGFKSKLNSIDSINKSNVEEVIINCSELNSTISNL